MSILHLLGFAAVSLLCGILLWPQLSAAWPSIEEKIDRFRRLSPIAKLVLLLFVGIFVVFGSTKTNLIDQASGTNIVIGASSLGGRISAKCSGEEVVGGVSGDAFHGNASTEVTPTVTPEDIARGWQLWEVRTNSNVCYTMPEGATLASNWWVRGAFEDCLIVRLGGCSIGGYVNQSNNPNSQTMSFPFGTNEYDSVWAFSWGKLRFVLGDAESEIAAVGAPMSAVPYRSRLWSVADTNGARIVTWENFALNRDTNTLINAQVELRTTGDFIARSNEVETVYHHIDDFDWDGDGIVNEDDWNPYGYDGDCTGQEPWWRGYVDEMVGVGQTNGYYKLTATVSDRDFRRRVITVGNERVVAAEPGEYVFLLEKGLDYEIDVYPFSPGVTFEAVDDLPLGPWMFGLLGGWWHWTVWSIDEGRLMLRYPTLGQTGFCCWLPTFQVTPSANHLGPGDSPQTFTAMLTDYAYGQTVWYHWHSNDSNIIFGSPDSESTTISVVSMPMWGESEIVATALIGTNELRSVCHFTYGVDPKPLVHIDIDAPSALLLNSNNVDSAKMGQICVWFTPDVETNGTLILTSSSSKVRLSPVAGSGLSWAVENSGVFYVDVEGVETSEFVDDIELSAAFLPEKGDAPVVKKTTLTVVQIGDVQLPGAPDDGLVAATNELVDVILDITPADAGHLLSTIWQVRRIRRDGTFTEWNYVGANYGGNERSLNLPGGIYQVRAFAGVGWGVDEERYYLWTSDENATYGFRKRGALKSFGVVSCDWQKALRGRALTYLGSKAYLATAELPAKNGFPAYQAGTFKCNVFVAHCIVESGLTVPRSRGFRNEYPPLANDWGSVYHLIVGWGLVDDDAFPEPGYIVADPYDEGSGHMGILDFDGQAISAGVDCVNRIMDGCVDGLVLRDYRR